MGNNFYKELVEDHGCGNSWRKTEFTFPNIVRMLLEALFAMNAWKSESSKCNRHTAAKLKKLFLL
ncbi:hypothetical protein TSUD_365980 [Trifolium subterraneum]|uniref:Uncharacterized protein n=1 Tax=Trifolium subterraneum TaxID=3900 RepID=A0A2Z6NDF3_TRISU|nr:hypothetical protein TSUD_365980 [Trifolium subterraneum]